MVSREDDRYPIEITHVIDGDGFQAKALDGSNRAVEVRLYAIDAPEGGQKYGQEATKHLRQVVRDGRFWLQVRGQDPNGRTVAVVYKDSLETSHTLNYLMVRAGWAYWYSHYEDGGNELGLKEAEVTAYMEGLGVWQEPGLERPWAFKERVRQEVEEKARQEKLRQEAEEKARQERDRREADERARVARERREADERARQERVRREDKERARRERLRREADEKARQERVRREDEERARRERLRQEAEERARRKAGEGERRETEERERPVIALTPEKERRLAEAKEIRDGIARQRMTEDRER